MSWWYANVGKGMVSLRDHTVFVRLLQPEIDYNSQHARHGDIVDHAYTCAYRTPPIEYEAQEDTFLLLSWCVTKAISVPFLPPSNPAARVMPCGPSRPPHSSAVIQVCEWLFSFILIDRQFRMSECIEMRESRVNRGNKELRGSQTCEMQEFPCDLLRFARRPH